MIIDILNNLVNRVSIIAVLSFFLSKVEIVRQLISKNKINKSDKLLFAVFFGILGIVGTYSGIPVKGALANSRVIGVFVGGLLGGPLVGVLSGLIAGIHRWGIDIGGFTALACAISTTLEGTIAGLLSSKFYKSQNKWFFALITGAIAEVIQMIVILIVAKPFSEALNLVSIIALPMIVANSIGISITIAIIQSILRDKERAAAFQAQRALIIANETLPYFRQGFNKKTAKKVASLIYNRTDVKSVSITNTDIILAHIGIGEDHHRVGDKIRTGLTKEVISTGKYKVAKHSKDIDCDKKSCKLKSAIIAPLKEGNKTIGTLKLYKTSEGSISPVDLELALGLASLFSTQIELGKIETHKELATKAELKALQAQINPHFLFNAINTIVSLIRTKPDKARDLLIHLGLYFRKNLHKNEDEVNLDKELQHVKSYLEIEKARFGEKLEVKFDIPKNIKCSLPPLILQPIIENSIKHGIMNKLENGIIKIKATKEKGHIKLSVEDNGDGIPEKELKYLLSPSKDTKSIGLRNVNNRLKLKYGEEYGINIKSKVGEGSIVTIKIPDKGEIK